MKKSVMLLVAFLLLVTVAGTAHAVPLTNGGFVTPTGAPTPAGTLVASLTTSFVGTFGRIAGNVVQNVFSNATGLLFEYIVNSTSTGTITQVSTSFYDGFTSDADGQVAPAVPHADLISRGADGETVTWSYISNSIQQGQSSGSLWVQTNATTYAQGQFSLLGADTATFHMYAPNAAPLVPEPASMSLIGLGLVGLVGAFRRKFMA